MSLLLLLAACTSATPGEDSPTQTELRDEYPLDGEDSYPESVAWDPEGRAFYTSSLDRGDVTKILADGMTSTFYAGKNDHPWVTVGLEVDSTRRRLWVCASVFDGSAAGELWMINLDNGSLIQSLTLGGARTDASCTDVFLDSDGIAYVTDRENPDVYRVNAETGSAEILVEDPLLDAALVGLNGVAITPDGKNLLVTKYLDATLADRLFTLTSADGSWTEAALTSEDLEEGGVTGLTAAEGSLYGANGHAVEYSLGIDPDTDFWIRKLKE